MITPGNGGVARKGELVAGGGVFWSPGAPVEPMNVQTVLLIQGTAEEAFVLLHLSVHDLALPVLPMAIDD